MPGCESIFKITFAIVALQGEKKLCLLITNSAIYAELHCCAKILPRIHCVGELFLPSNFEQHSRQHL